MRKIKYANEYQLMFNLLNADPQSLLMDWNIDDAIKDYFQDFVAIMKKLFDIKVASQVQYYTTLAIQPEKVGSSHVLYPHHLPHFINSAEWEFDGSSVSTSPPINFVLYVPTQSQSPLYIASANTKDAPLVETNAFSIPQWGGIVVLNPDQHSPKIQTNSQTNVRIYKLDSKEELEGPMNVFLEQMRGLLGVKTVELGAAAEKLLPGFSFTYAGSTAGITKWELDRLTRYTTVKNVGDAISTLNSLITLIESMENMVVLDHIRDEIMLSLNAIHKVQQILSDPLAGGVSEEDGGHVNQHDVALAASIAAITAAERAFFDPTMVSLLYFPDEHKLAVYLPLFLPVLVPLFSTIVQEIKKEIQKRKGGKVKSE
ncbi:phosphatidylinositol-glycan biosynthesis class S protein [Obelidium mucronatum]|nr:phosphatidylinositol-glycan biosynthesis class S protein [Obelidium mucronatum]